MNETELRDLWGAGSACNELPQIEGHSWIPESAGDVSIPAAPREIRSAMYTTFSPPSLQALTVDHGGAGPRRGVLDALSPEWAAHLRAMA